MTGFGVGDASLPGGRVVAEIRSVNQRFLDVRARLPRELADLSLFAEQVARERLRRGRVDLVVHTEGAPASGVVLDKGRARAALRAFAELRDELVRGHDGEPPLPLGAEIPMSLLAAVPELFAPPTGTAQEALRSAVKLAIERAVDAMETMCRREGDALAADLRARCATLREMVAAAVSEAESTREAARRRLRDRTLRLLADAAIEVDASRIEAEVVLLAERSDVTEEITRLQSHLDQLGAALSDGRSTPTVETQPRNADEGEPARSSAASQAGAKPRATSEPVGRRLDFLLQEMLREANTLGAKAQDAALSHRVVAIKVELERLREQVQNIE
ncbi:Hypothetical protein A7982_02480 [Minicystis rosea]|nr:Hypothetical protein A7982_02480 [Minicystis rosea]